MTRTLTLILVILNKWQCSHYFFSKFVEEKRDYYRLFIQERIDLREYNSSRKGLLITMSITIYQCSS